MAKGKQPTGAQSKRRTAVAAKKLVDPVVTDPVSQDSVNPEQTKPKAGRPVGAKTQKLIASTAPGRCPKCGSTDREPYHDVRAMQYSGTTEQGDAYTHIVWRRTRCKCCAQSRIDRSYENRKGIYEE